MKPFNFQLDLLVIIFYILDAACCISLLHMNVNRWLSRVVGVITMGFSLVCLGKLLRFV